MVKSLMDIVAAADCVIDRFEVRAADCLASEDGVAVIEDVEAVVAQYF